MEGEVLRVYLSDLVSLLQSCVKSVADSCFSQSLICQTIYSQIISPAGQDYHEDLARKLVLAVIARSRIDQNGGQFEAFCVILQEQAIFNDLIRKMKQTLRDMETEREQKALCTEDVGLEMATGKTRGNPTYTRKLSKKDSGYEESLAGSINEAQLDRIPEGESEDEHMPLSTSTPKPFQRQNTQESGIWMTTGTDQFMRPSQEIGGSRPSRSPVLNSPPTPRTSRRNEVAEKLLSLGNDLQQLEATEIVLREEIEKLEKLLQTAQKTSDDLREMLDIKDAEIKSLKLEKRESQTLVATQEEEIQRLSYNIGELASEDRPEIGGDKADQILGKLDEMRMERQKEKDCLTEMLKTEQETVSELLAKVLVRKDELELKEKEQPAEKVDDSENLVKEVTKEKEGRLMAEGQTLVCTALCFVLVLVIALMALQLWQQGHDSLQCWLSPGGKKYPFL